MMDLSKAFDAIPHSLLLAKLHAYGCDMEVLKLAHSYLSDRWQRTKVGSCRSDWMKLTKGVPQGSVLGPLFFNIFTNDIYYCLEQSEMFNYADDDSLSHEHENFDTFKEELEIDGNNVTDWFEQNWIPRHHVWK